MSWRFALFLGFITAIAVYVTSYFVARYMDQPPLPLWVVVVAGIVSAILQKRLGG